jgi:hypothetical protein
MDRKFFITTEEWKLEKDFSRPLEMTTSSDFCHLEFRRSQRKFGEEFLLSLDFEATLISCRGDRRSPARN